MIQHRLAQVANALYFVPEKLYPMAISKNLLMTGVTGGINKQIVFRRYRSKTVVSAYPDMSNRKLSPKQIRRTKILKKANRVIKLIKADEEQRKAAQLRLNVPSNRLHHALLKEVMLELGQTMR